MDEVASCRDDCAPAGAREDCRSLVQVKFLLLFSSSFLNFLPVIFNLGELWRLGGHALQLLESSIKRTMKMTN